MTVILLERVKASGPARGGVTAAPAVTRRRIANGKRLFRRRRVAPCFLPSATMMARSLRINQRRMSQDRHRPRPLAAPEVSETKSVGHLRSTHVGADVRDA